MQAALSVSQATLSRLITANASRIIKMGRGPATQYALRRAVAGMGSEHALSRITREGRVEPVGVLSVVHGGYWFENTEHTQHSRFYEGLPWFLSDMRPQGFLGRSFAKHFADADLPSRVSDWQDDHVLLALTRYGADSSGNLLVGEAALRIWSSRSPVMIEPDQRALVYPRLADEAMAGESAGSSAAGEQPKFTAMIGAESPYSVLVKFSGDTRSAIGQRWSDLLIAEHHALGVMRENGYAAAQSEILRSAHRTFLEVKRFDRLNLHGRLGLISLGAFDDEFIGRRRHWLNTAQALVQQKLLAPQALPAIAWQQAFAELIANTDRHFGNLSLCFDGSWPATLAPAYDMLPMFDSPRSDGAIQLQPFSPALPVGYGDDIAQSALKAAVEFWGEVAGDERVSVEYREEALRRRASAVLISLNVPRK
jgi:hypothetical protein